MKQKFLLKTMLLLCALMVGSGSVWADDHDITFSTSNGTYNSTDKTITWDDTYCTILQEKGSSTTNVNSSYVASPRWYASHLITFTPKGSYAITKIVITATGSSNNGQNMTMNNSAGGTIANTSTTVTTWTGTITNSSPLQLKMGSQCRPSSVTITYSQKKNTTTSISPSTLNLTYGGSNGTLTATVTPEGESALSNPTITWSSSNEAVATVSGGTVTPHAEGSATITANFAGDNSNNGSYGTATVNVTDNRTAVVSEIKEICSQKTLYIGGEIAFEPVVTLADGLSASDVTYSYVSAAPETIRINGNGTYTVLKTGTNIDITVTVTPISSKLSTHKPVTATFQHNGTYRYTGLTLPETAEFNGSKEITMTIANNPQGPIYYTTNGNDPLEDVTNRISYSGAFTINATTTINARVIDSDGLYSTMQTATYTRVPDNKNAITLTAGQTLSFTDFSDVSTSYGDTEKYLIASDGDKYKWNGSNYCRQSSALQLKGGSGTITSSTVTAPNGFRMTLTVSSGSVKVYVGETEQTAVSTNTYVIPSGSAVQIRYANSNLAKVSNITFTALKPTRSVTFPDGDQTITVDGETITKTATISPTGTANYSSSDATIATVNSTTGEVTAVKGGEVTITATVAADNDYEESKGSYTVTVNKAATTLAFDHAEETVELVDGTATFSATASPADGTRTITYSTASDKITLNSSTGAVTYTETGDYVIKANANATDKYLAPSEASYTLHVVDNRQPVVDEASLNLVLTDALDDPIALNGVSKDDEGFLSATYSKATGFSGTEVVTFATSDASVLKIENGNEFAALKGGTAKVTVTVTSGGNKMFTTVEKEFTVTVTNNSKSATEIAVMDEDINIYEDGDALNLTYGTPMTLDVSATTGYEGTISRVLGNDQIVSVGVEGTTYTITPLAVGSTTLTLSAPETANYAAASNVVLTINVAQTTAKTTTGYVDGVVEEIDFAEYLVPDTWVMTTTNSGNYQAWTNNDVNDFISANGYKSGTRYAGTYDYITDEYDLTNYSSATLTFNHAGQYFGSLISNGVKLFAKVGSEEQELTINTYFVGSSYSSYVKNETNINSLCGSKAKIIFRYISDGTSTNTGRWDIKDFKISGQTLPTVVVTVAASGYGTYCYEYPLDLDQLDDAVKAYIVTNVSGSTVTFTQITGKIKGGVPFILYGTEGNYTLTTAASSSTVPANNMLVGTLAPKYITTVDGDYTNFGLSGGSFVKINSGTVPANKAYLPILTSNLPSASRLSIVFENEETGIKSTMDSGKFLDNTVYNLRGQRVDNPTKGGLYIVNGRKVVIK